LSTHRICVTVFRTKEQTLAEESNYHYLNNVVLLTRLKIERAEMKYQRGEEKQLSGNFKTYKELYKVVAAWSYPAFINEGPNND